MGQEDIFRRRIGSNVQVVLKNGTSYNGRLVDVVPPLLIVQTNQGRSVFIHFEEFSSCEFEESNILSADNASRGSSQKGQNGLQLHTTEPSSNAVSASPDTVIKRRSLSPMAPISSRGEEVQPREPIGHVKSREKKLQNPPVQPFTKAIADQSVIQAKFALQRNDHSNAIKHLKEALRVDPDHLEAQQLLEKCRDIAYKMSRSGKTEEYSSQRKGLRGETQEERLLEQARLDLSRGDHSNAIKKVRELRKINPAYPGAQQLLDECLSIAKTRGVPKGTDLYSRALKAQTDKEAIELYENALQAADRQKAYGRKYSSAVKNLANLYAKGGEEQKAVDLLLQRRPNISDKQSVDNVLIEIYWKQKQYKKSLELLQKKIERNPFEAKNINTLNQMVSCYIELGLYTEAEQLLQKSITLAADHVPSQRRLAIYYLKMKRYQKAKEILANILQTFPDDEQARELLKRVENAESTGLIDDDSDLDEPAISKFAKFFLDHCKMKGLPQNPVQENRFDLSHCNLLEDQARHAKDPDRRAELYLTAATLVYRHRREWPEPSRLYNYLYRSLVSRGDASVGDKSLDTVREWYSEALRVYDEARKDEKDEKDAVNALVRFLYSYLGEEWIPRGDDIPSIDYAIEMLLVDSQAKEAFDAIAYLTFHSKYARERLLERIAKTPEFRDMALEYLKDHHILSDAPSSRKRELVQLWHEMHRIIAHEKSTIAHELRQLTEFDFSPSRISEVVQRLPLLTERLYFQLDKDRIGKQLHDIFDLALSFCKAKNFEGKERYCKEIKSSCLTLKEEIIQEPTRFSVEELYKVVERIYDKAEMQLKQIYESSEPSITIRPEIESYPDSSRKIDVQIAMINEIFCRPADVVELHIQEDKEFFTVEGQREINGSLRGGEKKVDVITLHITEKAIAAHAFSLRAFVTYQTEPGDTKKTAEQTLSISLYNPGELEEIENPFTFAYSGPVTKESLFYGREEYIRRIVEVMSKGRARNKSILIYGQKRVGKSTLLHHAKLRLEREADLLVVEFGSVARIASPDPNNRSPLGALFLWTILYRLSVAVRRKAQQIGQNLPFDPPEREAFLDHPTPQLLFQESFDSFQELLQQTKDWQDIRVVLLIDEFQYIYQWIVKKKLPEDFMRTWKALLQQEYFNVVLVGLDVMTKFMARFPNELATTEPIRISYLRPEEAKALIEEPIWIGDKKGGKSRYIKPAAEYVLNLTSGSPYYIQILCYHLVEDLKRRKAQYMTVVDVDRIKKDLLRGVLKDNEHFDNLISTGDPSEDDASTREILKVVACIAKKSEVVPCSREDIDCEIDAEKVDRILEDLVRRDILQCTNSRYYTITVGLFRDWLIERH
jgi:tetratricopeptide (TPR) repeat protein